VPPDERREARVAERVEELRERTGVDLRLGWELTPIAELLDEDPRRYALEGLDVVLMEVPFTGPADLLVALAEHPAATRLTPLGRRTSTRPTGARSPSSGRRPARSSTGLPSALLRDGLHLAQRRQAPERVELDLADALAREPEPPADLLERLRLGVVEPVAELEHAPLALRQRVERRRERLAAERDLDLVLGERPVAGDEVPEDGVLLVADR